MALWWLFRTEHRRERRCKKVIPKKNKRIRTLLILILVIFFYPAATNAFSNQKFDFLLRFFDMNEAAFAYHRHCLSQTESINATFLKTFEMVADELFAEARKNEPNIDPKYIKAKILERRYNAQYKLDHANIREGCHSQASIEAIFTN